MKPKTILALVLLIGFTSLLLFNFGQQVGGYMTFTEAQKSGGSAHVVGEWVPDRPLSYAPDQNVFSFYMQDEKGDIRQVQYPHPKPANFEDAERVVVEGRIEGEIFIADHILVKCPSKYNDAQAAKDFQ